MKDRSKVILAMLTLALAMGPAAADQARVRVVHASPDAPAVDIIVDDAGRPFTGVAFGETTSYAAVPANVYNVKVAPAGGGSDSAVIDTDLNLFYNRTYTVVAVDELSSIKPIVLEDDNTPSPFRQARLRFVHASPDAPAVDIKVVDGPYLFQGVAFTEVGDYVSLPDGIYSIEVRVAGTDLVALDLPAVSLEGGTTYTVFAVGRVTGEPVLQAMLTEDFSSPSATAVGRPIGKPKRK